jgi:hypothetical protein
LDNHEEQKEIPKEDNPRMATESYPVKVAEYAKANRIAEEPAFL